MVGDEDAHIQLYQLSDNILDIENCDRIDTGERLIEEEKFGFSYQGAGDLYASSLSAAQTDTQTMPDRIDIEHFQQFVDTRIHCLLVHFQSSCRHQEIFLDGQILENTRLLRQIPYACFCPRTQWHMRDRFSIDQHLSVSRIRQTADHIETCRFSGTVWTKKPYHLSAFEL